MKIKIYFFILFALPFLSYTQEISKATISDMKFRHVGPVGNRLTCVAGVANKPMIYYVGAASGGVWKTKDGGLNWFPIFDSQ